MWLISCFRRRDGELYVETTGITPEKIAAFARTNHIFHYLTRAYGRSVMGEAFAQVTAFSGVIGGAGVVFPGD